MMMKEIRIFLIPGIPLYFIPGNGSKPESRCSLTLTKFVAQMDRVEWEVTQGDGQIIVGRVRQTRPLPMFSDGALTLSLPVKLHINAKGLMCPDFIVRLPSLYVHSTGK